MISCETYVETDVAWVDAPAICQGSESEDSSATLNALADSDRVLLVVRADQAGQQLERLVPLVDGMRGLVVLTFADHLPEATDRMRMGGDLRKGLGVPVFLVDARKIDGPTRIAIREAATDRRADRFRHRDLSRLPARRLSGSGAPTGLERAVAHPLVAASLLLLPTAIAVTQANRFADWLYGPLTEVLAPLHTRIGDGPAFSTALLAGDYGLVSMFPFLLLYALPTVLAFSAILAVYKSSGLIDRLSVALHLWLRPFGIGGRDLVNVVMGFGCNVPAVVASRSCASCSRGTCVSAISFGSACSYQLPATLAVFAAADLAGLGIAYIAILAVTTLIYLRFTTPKALRLAGNALLLPEAGPLQAPSMRGMLREVLDNLRQFVTMAFPVFVGICFAAATLHSFGAFDALSRLLAPLMALFRLPGEAAAAVALGSVRKDGIAIGLLDDDWGNLKVGLGDPAQVLTAVYLAGVMLPCLVTLCTIGREMRWSFAARLCLRQMAWASAFGLAIAWVGFLF